MTRANWFTPRRRRAETSRRTSVVPPLTASEPVKVPEPRRSPEDATGALRAFRGDREFWLVANGRGDVWGFDTKAEALKWVDHRVACGEAPAVWPVRVESEESA